jgi:hypothetical protein
MWSPCPQRHACLIGLNALSISPIIAAFGEEAVLVDPKQLSAVKAADSWRAVLRGTFTVSCWQLHCTVPSYEILLLFLGSRGAVSHSNRITVGRLQYFSEVPASLVRDVACFCIDT